MDPIANMLIQIKNAGMAGRGLTAVPYSRVKHEIAKVLEREKYLASVEERGEGVKKELVLGIAYKGKIPCVANVKRVSKPSRRTYMGVKDMNPVRQGRGSLVLSTPKGIMTDKEAKKEHVGGEALFTIW